VGKLFNSFRLPPLSGFQLRVGAYCVLPALAASTGVAGFIDFESHRLLVRSCFLGTLGVALFVWALWLCRSDRDTRATQRGALRVLDVLCANALISLLLVEGILSVWSHYRPAPIFWGGSVTARIESLRPAPGRFYLTTHLNSGGYHDEEFFASGPDDLVVAVLADSFGLGVVPYESNFVTLAERRLQGAYGDRFRRVALHNFGIPGIGMGEYAHLLATEVEPTEPDLVVLSVFIGNDIFESTSFGRGRGRSRYVLQDWLVWSVPKRLWVMHAERRARERENGAPGRTGGATATVPDLYDERGHEKPSYSFQKFLSIERFRMQVSNPSNPVLQERFQSFLRALDHFHAKLGPRLLVVLIPDEFQVNDELYHELVATFDDPHSYQRDYPQERIRAYCDQQGIALLDLLPALRSAQKTARTYHLRDTHINTHGNRVVGEALAAALLERLSP
jgi:hypothetical protein